MTNSESDKKEVDSGNKWMDEIYQKYTGMSHKGHIFKKVV